MKTYTIYIKKEEDVVRDVMYIPEGFSFLAFFFSFFWLIFHRLWRESIFYMLAYVVLQQLNTAEVISAELILVMLVIFSLVIGFSGNDMVGRRALRDGYQFYDVVIASSETEAELRYISQNISINSSFWRNPESIG